MWVCMQVCKRARCGVVAAARLHRRLQHPPPFALGFSLAAVLPLACLTSRPAALRDAPRSFTFKIIRNHCKNSLCNKNISSLAAVAFILKTERFFKLFKKHNLSFKVWMHSSLHVPRVVMRTPYWRSRWRRAVPPYLSRPPTSKINR